MNEFEVSSSIMVSACSSEYIQSLRFLTVYMQVARQFGLSTRSTAIVLLGKNQGFLLKTLALSNITIVYSCKYHRY